MMVKVRVIVCKIAGEGTGDGASDKLRGFTGASSALKKFKTLCKKVDMFYDWIVLAKI